MMRCTYINEHNFILSSCLFTERETRDLHRERETAGDRDPDALFQNYAGIHCLVRDAFCFNLPSPRLKQLGTRTESDGLFHLLVLMVGRESF